MTKNLKMSTIITNLRGARVTPIHRGSVLLSKQEDLCSTSYIEDLDKWIKIQKRQCHCEIYNILGFGEISKN